MSRMGFYGDNSTSMGVRRDLGLAALTVTGERGEVHQPGFIPIADRSPATASAR